MDTRELLRILQRAEAESGPSGETALDALARRAGHDSSYRTAVIAALRELGPSLQAAALWRTVEILLRQLNVNDVGLGEAIEQRLSAGSIQEPEARLWAARCILVLGATLTGGSYAALADKRVIGANPTEWFAIMGETRDSASVDAMFRDLPSKVTLKRDQASDLVRTFKRIAPSLRISVNGPLSSFFSALPLEDAIAVASRLETVIGPSFAESLRGRIAQSSGYIIGDTPSSEYDFKDLFDGVRRVAEKTDWSFGQARMMEAA